MNGATLSQIENIENQLNEIYAQANVTFNVTIAENYNSTTWDLNADGKLQNGDISLVSHYSDEMRLLREQYFESDSADHQNKYYLFIIPEFYEAELEGYMVRGKALGFLKAGENAITAAHELAHGIFSLEHTFPQIAQATTPTLLDYSGGHTSHKNSGNTFTHRFRHFRFWMMRRGGSIYYCYFKMIIFQFLGKVSILLT
ncbi:MAG: hypothetical protein IPM74_08590 [Crocinitomicaceae bacterium]|nr:hypothetical protein [Crocinitomicaceae bacterium]